MKKAFYFFLLIILVSGCEKLRELLTFEISNSANIEIPATGLLNSPFVSPVAVPVSSQQTFANNNTTAELVKDVRLTKLTLTIVDPSNENFDFLKSIRIYIGTSEDDKVPLAYLNTVPTGVSSIELVSENTQLDQYIKAS